jgi:hypothetical protein
MDQQNILFLSTKDLQNMKQSMTTSTTLQVSVASVWKWPSAR